MNTKAVCPTFSTLDLHAVPITIATHRLGDKHISTGQIFMPCDSVQSVKQGHYYIHLLLVSHDEQALDL